MKCHSRTVSPSESRELSFSRRMRFRCAASRYRSYSDVNVAAFSPARRQTLLQDAIMADQYDDATNMSDSDVSNQQHFNLTISFVGMNNQEDSAQHHVSQRQPQVKLNDDAAAKQARSKANDDTAQSSSESSSESEHSVDVFMNQLKTCVSESRREADEENEKHKQCLITPVPQQKQQQEQQQGLVDHQGGLNVVRGSIQVASKDLQKLMELASSLGSDSFGRVAKISLDSTGGGKKTRTEVDAVVQLENTPQVQQLKAPEVAADQSAKTSGSTKRQHKRRRHDQQEVALSQQHQVQQRVPKRAKCEGTLCTGAQQLLEADNFCHMHQHARHNFAAQNRFAGLHSHSMPVHRQSLRHDAPRQAGRLPASDLLCEAATDSAFQPELGYSYSGPFSKQIFNRFTCAYFR